jgi:hypothetical protein
MNHVPFRACAMPKLHVPHAAGDEARGVTWPKAQPKYFPSPDHVPDEQRALFPVVNE